MMQFPSDEKLALLRKKYPVGTKIRLVFMDDSQAPKSGTIGTVTGVDDVGDLLMQWDSGGTLALIEGVDEFEILNGGGADF